MDVGTNSEIALYHEGTLWITSVAGGPAFETSGASWGMPAEEGAVYHVRREGEAWAAEVYGGGQGEGICGSGMVDLVALLRDGKILDEKGRFADGADRWAFPGNGALRVSKHDVDIFQRAKGALAVGMETLCEKAGIGYEAIRTLYVAGAFGRELEPGAAVAVGLLPPLPPERIRMVGNTALRGCEALLSEPEASCRWEKLKERLEIVNLSRIDGFEYRFLEHLYLRPWESR